MEDGYTIDDTGAAVYPNGFRWACEDMGCAFVAREWHGGQGSALYALGCGDFSPETVSAAAVELWKVAIDNTPGESVDVISALTDLEAWAEGVADLLSD